MGICLTHTPSPSVGPSVGMGICLTHTPLVSLSVGMGTDMERARAWGSASHTHIVSFSVSHTHGEGH